jgi:hypothetical protein
LGRRRTCTSGPAASFACSTAREIRHGQRAAIGRESFRGVPVSEQWQRPEANQSQQAVLRTSVGPHEGEWYRIIHRMGNLQAGDMEDR